MKKIVYITETRAEYGLMSAVLKEIQNSKELDLTLIATGMHLMPEFGYTINEIKNDGYKTEIIHTTYEKDDLASTLKFISKFLEGLTIKISKIKPDIILILGDKAEALAGAIVGQYLNIPVAHISGGDITGHVDDAIRHAITKLSHIHFPISDRSAEKIVKMGENKNRIFIAGATSIDNIKTAKLPKKQLLFKKYRIDESLPFIIIIKHPVITEIDEVEEHTSNILDAVTELKIQSIIIYPNADAGGKKIIRTINKYKSLDNVKIFPHIPYIDYLGLYKYTTAILGNSSSAIVESTSFGIPAINIGNRQRGREKADNVIDIGYDKQQIKKALKKALYDESFKQKCRKAISPYGDGTASKKIVDVLIRLKINRDLLDKKNKQRVLRPKFKRFNDIKEEDINFDFHMHTNQTDGKNTAEEMVIQAKKMKLKSIAFSEHVNSATKWYNDFFQKTDKLRKNEEINILIGIEAKPIDFHGTLDASEEIIEKADIIIGSVHRYPDGKGGLISINEVKNLGEEKAAETEFKLAMGLLKNNQIDVLGHPFGVYYKFYKKFQGDLIEELITEATKKEIAFEINTKYNTHRDKFFKLFKKINPYVSLGSNAHNVKEIAFSFNDIKREIGK